jgi:hypothetical protein
MSMRLEIDRTTIVFILFLVIIGAIFGINYLMQNQAPISITVAVDPLAEEWARAAAQAFNASNPVVNVTTRLQVEIIVTDDVDVWHGNPGWSATSRPDGWLASSSASVSYVPPSLPMIVVQSTTARTPLVWGAFDSRLAVMTGTGELFDWQLVQTVAAAQRWQNLGVANDPANINMALNWPSSSMSGIGVLLTAAGSFAQTSAVDRDLLTDAAFSAWFTPIADSMLNARRIGGSPALAMATRGTAVADYALLPESQWLTGLSGLVNERRVTFSYPAHQFMLDFPLAAWSDAETDAARRAGVEAFGTFLIGETGQALAVEHGLRPVSAEPTSAASLFAAGLAQGILLEPDYGQQMQAPDRATADALIRLLE